jgi:hypothetical protein
MNDPAVSFGDHVRIRSTPLTRKLGFADLLGNVHGQTKPSFTGIDVIGEAEADYAMQVFFEERREEFWFAPSLVELLDHAPGTEISFKGTAKKWLRSASDEWEEFDNVIPSRIKRPGGDPGEVNYSADWPLRIVIAGQPFRQPLVRRHYLPCNV